MAYAVRMRWMLMPGAIGLLAAGVSAADPSAILTSGETAHLRRALGRLNMTDRDLAFEKDVGKPMWALQWVREAMRRPLELPRQADRILGAARSPAADEVWSVAARLLETDAAAAVRPRTNGPPVDLPAGLDARLAEGLRAFVADAEQAQTILAGAWTALTPAGKCLAAAACLGGLFNAEDRPDVAPLLTALGIPADCIQEVIRAHSALDPAPFSSNITALAVSVDLAALLSAGKAFHAAVVRLERCAHEVREWPAAPVILTTRAGRLVIGTPGGDVHTNAALLVLDPGGNDRYAGAAGAANGLTGQPLAAIVDLGGQDIYAESGMLAAGSALFGVAVVRDSGGNDVYLAAWAGLGAALFGVAWMEDAGGADTYRAGGFAQGAATVGVGVLRDVSGNDLYDVGLCGQAYAGCRGMGLLIDDEGNDRYVAGGREPDWERLEDRFISLAQGCAMGDRPVAGGGVAALIDRRGNDAYVADVYGQAVGYWYAAGFLLDLEGNDTYTVYQYGQGSGIHLSLGLLLDAAGNDAYTGHALVQGNAHDYAVGMLIDRGGNDVYTGASSAQGRALFNAFALLLDAEGDDAYFAADPEACQGIGHDGGPREYGGLAILMDLAGQDRYSCGMTNTAIRLRPNYGAIYDASPAAAGAR